MPCDGEQQQLNKKHKIIFDTASLSLPHKNMRGAATKPLGLHVAAPMLNTPAYSYLLSSPKHLSNHLLKLSNASPLTT